jgi:Papain-like cysteine protease AvrRpt2
MQTFQIPDVPLIPQDKNMACWYASAQMLITWRQMKTLSCETSHPLPGNVPELKTVYVANDGLPFSLNIELARDLGLVDVPPMTPSPGALASLLKRYGPLWFCGLFPQGHVVVITGVSSSQLWINDPWPVNHGARRVISLEDFGKADQILGFQYNFAALGISPNLLHFPGRLVMSQTGAPF